MYGPSGKIICFVLLWLIAFILLFGLKVRNNHGKKIMVFCSIVAFSLLVGYSDLLVDYHPYKETYDSYTAESILASLNVSFINLFTNDYEPLYLVAMLVFKSAGLSFSFFLFFQTFIIQLFVLFLLVPRRYDIYKSYLLFYLFCMFVPMGYRQFFADVLFLSTYLYSSIIITAIVCLVGALYHYSNLVGFSRIINGRISPKKPIAIFLVVVLISLAVRFGLNAVLVNSGDDNRILFKLKYYLEYDQKWYAFQTPLHQFVHILISFVFPASLIIVFLVYGEKVFAEKRIYNSVFFCILVYLFSFIVFGSYTFSYRIFLTLSLPICLIKKEGDSKKQMSVLSAVLVMSNIVTSVYYVFTYLGWDLL